MVRQRARADKQDSSAHTNGNHANPSTIPIVGNHGSFTSSPPKHSAIPIEEFKSRELQWLLKDLIPFGALTVLEGRKGQGKSSIGAAIAAIASNCAKFPGRRSRKKYDVLIMPGEENPHDQLRRKLKAAGCAKGRVHVFGRRPDGAPGEPAYLPACIPDLRDECIRLKIKVIIIDPLASFVPQGYSLSNEQDVRTILEPLLRLAEELGIAVIFIRHVRKSSGGPAVDAGMGSVAIGAVCRSILRSRPRGTEKRQFTLSVVAGNLASETPTLAYNLATVEDVPCVVWRERLTLSDDELPDDAEDPGERDKRVAAREIIREELSQGAQPAKAILEAGEDAGIGSTTMYRAKRDLKVTHKKSGFGKGNPMKWFPPAKGWPDAP